VKAEAIAYCESLPEKSFDAVLAIDLLEHFPKADAERLLHEMERVASQLAVVWTTLGMIEQGPYDVDGVFNPYEKHQFGPSLGWLLGIGWEGRAYPWWHQDRGGALLGWRCK
jgi:hypothetical protein